MSSAIYGGSKSNDNCTNVDSLMKRYYLSVMYSVIFIVGLLGNVTSIAIYLTKLRPWKSSSIIMFNLALTDLLYVLSLPFMVYYYTNGESWALGDFMCRFLRFGFHFNLYGSILFLTCLAVFRYVVAAHPLRAAQVQQKRWGILACAAVWAIAVAEIVSMLTMITMEKKNNKTHCLDFASNLPLKIHGHSVVSHKGLVYCIGGKTDDNKALNKMFVYNHKQSEWRELAAMKTARAMFGAVVYNGKIVVAGGVNEEGLTAASEVYDFGTNKWETFTDFPQERSSVNLLSSEGALYAVGGFTIIQNDNKEVVPAEVTDVWQYEEDKKEWSGMLREMRYAAGSSCVSLRLNAAKMPKL